jgi:putative acetyltransferase
MIIKTELPDHRAAIRQLLEAAFPTPAEADLVDQLRAEGDLVFSLVALEDDLPIGHIAFSKMQTPARALGLAPVSVAARCRRRGIAASLIEEGLSRSRDQGWEAVFVLGNPRYYRRFGFREDLALPFRCRYSGPNLMALALQANGLADSAGDAEYARAFLSLDDRH